MIDTGFAVGLIAGYLWAPILNDAIRALRAKLRV